MQKREMLYVSVDQDIYYVHTITTSPYKTLKNPKLDLRYCDFEGSIKYF